jgi:hypothetical protein
MAFATLNWLLVNRKSQRPHFPEKVSFESQAIVWED